MKFFRYCYGDFALSNEPGIEIDFHRMSLSDMIEVNHQYFFNLSLIEGSKNYFPTSLFSFLLYIFVFIQLLIS